MGRSACHLHRRFLQVRGHAAEKGQISHLCPYYVKMLFRATCQESGRAQHGSAVTVSDVSARAQFMAAAAREHVHYNKHSEVVGATQSGCCLGRDGLRTQLSWPCGFPPSCWRMLRLRGTLPTSIHCRLSCGALRALLDVVWVAGKRWDDPLRAAVDKGRHSSSQRGADKYRSVLCAAGLAAAPTTGVGARARARPVCVERTGLV